MCKYPIRILPKKQYVKHIDVDILCSTCEHSILARRLDVCEGGQLPFHEIGGQKLLNEDAISEDILDWSTNLLGGEFKIEDIGWKQKGSGIKDWDNEDVDICKYEDCYSRIETEYYSAFITVDCLHNKIIPYRRNFADKASLVQYYNSTGDITKETVDQWNNNKEIECQATIKVEHKPTMLNYWHMTVGIIPRDFKEPIPRDLNKQKSLKKSVKRALRLYILKNISCEIHQEYKIPENIYRNS